MLAVGQTADEEGEEVSKVRGEVDFHDGGRRADAEKCLLLNIDTVALQQLVQSLKDAPRVRLQVVVVVDLTAKEVENATVQRLHALALLLVFRAELSLEVLDRVLDALHDDGHELQHSLQAVMRRARDQCVQRLQRLRAQTGLRRIRPVRGRQHGFRDVREVRRDLPRGGCLLEQGAEVLRDRVDGETGLRGDAGLRVDERVHHELQVLVQEAAEDGRGVEVRHAAQRPDGRLLHQERLRVAHVRDQRLHRLRQDLAEGPAVRRALHDGAERVRRCLLVPPRLGVDVLVHERHHVLHDVVADADGDALQAEAGGEGQRPVAFARVLVLLEKALLCNAAQLLRRTVHVELRGALVPRRAREFLVLTDLRLDVRELDPELQRLRGHGVRRVGGALDAGKGQLVELDHVRLEAVVVQQHHLHQDHHREQPRLRRRVRRRLHVPHDEVDEELPLLRVGHHAGDHLHRRQQRLHRLLADDRRLLDGHAAHDGRDERTRLRQQRRRVHLLAHVPDAGQRRLAEVRVLHRLRGVAEVHEEVGPLVVRQLDASDVRGHEGGRGARKLVRRRQRAESDVLHVRAHLGADRHPTLRELGTLRRLLAGHAVLQQDAGQAARSLGLGLVAHLGHERAEVVLDGSVLGQLDLAHGLLANGGVGILRGQEHLRQEVRVLAHRGSEEGEREKERERERERGEVGATHKVWEGGPSRCTGLKAPSVCVFDPMKYRYC
eukprot:Rhum_TRINITY_DN15378_c7_g4::Rhum_TRINITY_DN15378_c7_g4_i1::g.154354::m.154354